ncbi:Trs120-domain-containing protein [Mollisia scopiformis]|uniref:Trs120-domain-containing protein n=1 Tax=Mollisia scopiformis TaxID=149040 RepID=A0A194XIW1_MOLSC|nr:Trs120-domain-containing protein [Mollisia scopiformis]KUJ20098.1 Trs120-domain-containing protein [Mollisia scopiformis]
MLDQLSPVAPARVRVVLLPIGQIKRARFLSFVDRLQPENVVRLGDISPDGRPNRNMFSPLAFPTGMIVYDLTTFYPPPSHVALSPFELYREPLVIIALADGAELDHVSYRGNTRRSLNGNGPPKPEHNLRELYQDLEDLRDRYPKALVHQILLFDYVPRDSLGSLPEGLVAIPPPADCKRTTMKTVMCDISSMLLAEMTTLAKSLQALNSIDSPSQAQINRQYNGAWHVAQADMLSRRNSQYSAQGDSRSGSPAGSVDRSHVRMSMPAVLRRTDSNASTPSARPSTPNGTPGLATTFDEIVGPNPGLPIRLATTDSLRDAQQQDKVSVQGFGSGSVSERSRNKGKGRIGIVIGSLYMKAGRWSDALKELIEAATIAKNALDHLWHAKALDNILVSMLMLAWTGIDFQIPQICYVSAEKTSSTPNSQDPRSPASNRLVSLQNLTVLLPELVDRILNLYARAANNTGESLPPYPFSESVIRFSKLLSAVHLAGGTIDDEVLQLMVLGIPFKKAPNLATARLNIRPTRTEIVIVLSRAFPTHFSTESLSVVDRTIILSGIASVLGSLGFHRKKAMVMRDLVSVLIPGLVQARIKGAADMGVHPAAGLAALNSVNGNANGAGALDLGEGDIETGVDLFLGSLGKIYGVVSSAGPTALQDSNDAAIARILHDASIRSFGGQVLKMDVLRSCINISEALPDFHGVLRFTADLLRTAGSGVAPGPRSEDASPMMSREEQVRLATNISRTLGAARNLGVKDLQAEYWDEFLLRGIELEPLQSTRTPIPHTKSELPGASAKTESQEVNPFIYNPFLRNPDTSAVDNLLVAGEGAVFRATLQNPYEFDVEIESIKLESEGAQFESTVQKTVIGPYRTQILTIAGTPLAAGELRITGCIIRVRGCRERRFPIFEEPWSPQRDVKVKTIGVAALFRQKDRPVSVSSGPVSTTPAIIPPKAKSLGLNVIERQPLVVVKSTNLSQSALMVLEGELQVFSITLQNLSRETPVDLVLFSFKDSTQAPLQTAMSNREASPAELYECELIFARKQALKWKKKHDEKVFIAPGTTETFDIEILGRPGLTSAVVQIDYAHLGVPAAEVQDNFHTRQVSLPLTVTVNASVEVVRVDVLPLTGNVPRSLWNMMATTNPKNASFTPEDYCLVVLDVRNAWPSQLHLHLDVANAGIIDEEILPGNTSKIMFPLHRIFLKDPIASIPALDPSRQRQFVVSTGRVSADSERASREAFWYREEILKMFHGTWATKFGPYRHGEIELRGIRLTQRMIEAIKIDDIAINISINHASEGTSKHQLFTDAFSELKVRISNRTQDAIHPMLRLQPSCRDQPHNLALDLTKKLVWNGVLQQTLPPLPGMESIEVSFGVTALARGEFEISVSVEETFLQHPPPQPAKGGRPRANTKQMMDAVLGARERRIWHSREPFLVVVKDDDSDED